MSKRTVPPGPSSNRGSLRSGALTGASTLVVSGVAAAVGVVIAREFGRTDETDGLLSAYGVFLVLVIAAQAIRIAILPQLARARRRGRLAGEVAALALAMAAIVVPLLLVAELATGGVAQVLTGNAPDVTQSTAADALRWMVPAACAHLFAALAASALAALDDYGTAALGYAAGGLGGLALILARVDADGIIVVAWGMVANGAIVLAVTLAGLLVHAARLRMPAHAVRPTGPPLHARLGAFGVSASLPLALQLLYVVCLPLASQLGTGAATTFVYAYLGASALVTVTASSLALVTSVPLARDVLSADLVTRHVAASSWLALAIVAPGAGILVVAGGDVVEAILGAAYGGDVGAELGRLVALLTLWVVAAVGIALTFPLLFIAGRTGWLPVVAAAAVLVQVPLAWTGRELFELEGLALSLALTTWATLALLLAQLGALEATLRRLVRIAAVVGLIAVAAYALPALVLDPYVAALVGSVVYVVLLAALRPADLRASWRYLHGLG